MVSRIHICVVLGEDGGKNWLYVGSTLFSLVPVSLIPSIFLLPLPPIIVAPQASVRTGTKTASEWREGSGALVVRLVITVLGHTQGLGNVVAGQLQAVCESVVRSAFSLHPSAVPFPWT